ncbi:MAG: hypothetical protein PW735_02160 [Acidobacteriaceae bacterium]|nr:hypothetical protein [Acidobacteriaceae bacterium]
MLTAAFGSLAMVMLQEGVHQDTHHASMFLGVIALCMVMQAVAVIAAAGAAWKLIRKMDGVADAFQQKSAPVLAKADALIDEIGPRVRVMSANAEQVSYVVRTKVDEMASTIDELNRTVQDINERSRVQVSRVDGIVTDALTTTYEVSRTVQESIKGPVRQVAGIIAGLKAGLETLLERSPFKPKARPDRYDL